jgi:hypothetical protein
MQKSSTPKERDVVPTDSMLLAFAQIIQPATLDDLYNIAKGSQLAEILTYDEFKKNFSRLERTGYFWRTADKRFIVTSKGHLLAQVSLKAKDRDRMRLLFLNKTRYENQ